MTIQTPNPTQQQRSARKKRALTAGAVAACLAVGSIGIGALTTLNTTIADNSAEVTTTEVVHPTLEMALSGSPFELAVGPDGVTGNTATSWTMTNSGDLDATWDGIFQLQTAGVSPEVAAVTRVTAQLSVRVDNGQVSGITLPVTLDLGTLANPVALSEARVIEGPGVWVFTGTFGTGMTASSTGAGISGAAVENPLRLAAGHTFGFSVTPAISADDQAAVEAAVDPDGVGDVTVRAVADFVATYMQAS